MKLDANNLRYLTRSHFRVLTAVEMGMRNHEIVPLSLVESIAKVKTGGVHKLMGDLLRNSLVHRDRSNYDGYRLTYMGYDYLALHTFVARGTITGLGRQIGVGKESDIYLAVDGEGRQMALKLHRLGRISFRNVRNKRDYMRNKQSKPGSWLYLSRLACLKEYAFMTALNNHKFPVPEPIDQNRHGILMSLCEGFPMTQVRHIEDPEKAYNDMMQLILRLGKYGLIHGDFNEYNLILGYDEKITLIDFPQMISTKHHNAKMHFDRDCQGVADFFRSRLGYHGSELPTFQDIGERIFNLDQEVEASGFSEKDGKAFDQLISEQDDTAEDGLNNNGVAHGVTTEGEVTLEDSVDGGETKKTVKGEESTSDNAVVSLISAVSLEELESPATSFLDQASRGGDDVQSGGDKKTDTVQESTTIPQSPPIRTAPPPKMMSEEEIKEKVRRAMRKKKNGKGGTKGRKNQNKNREKRRARTVVKNDR
jgi:RIO kinase 2